MKSLQILLLNWIPLTSLCRSYTNRRTLCTVTKKVRSLLFVNSFNRLTGRMEWEVTDEEEYDYHQEIARSGFADMLHDKERNYKFDEGIKHAVSLVHSRGDACRVLDIGAGTGLLSMMAMRAGAEKVTACEAFQPMAECAVDVIATNQMSDRIKLISKRSTDMTVGPDGDMSERANILVAELLDTELIGEGALQTYRHAHQHLLTPDCIVVPQAANIYIQLVQSPHLLRYNTLLPLRIDHNTELTLPQEVRSCDGSPSVHDIQLNQLPPDTFILLSQPIRIFRFDFGDLSTLPLKDHTQIEVPILQSGTMHAMFMWWDVELDSQATNTISCAPYWAHPSGRHSQWRDHWLQAVYYCTPIDVTQGETVQLHGYHDDYSFWFNVCQDARSEEVKAIERPICQCGVHVACGRQRLAMMNDKNRQETYINALRKCITKDSVCLAVSDGSLLGFLAALLGASKVYILERDALLRRLFNNIIICNQLENKVCLLSDNTDDFSSQHFHGNKIDVMIAEPHIFGSNLPVDDFYCWHVFSQLTNHMSPNITILPRLVTIKMIAVQFDDLWKISSQVGTCEGFDLSPFDRLIENSSNKSDTYLEAQPLWEYPCIALTQPLQIMQFDWTNPVYSLDQPLISEKTVPFEVSGMCNGVVVWTEDMFSNKVISNGLTTTPTSVNKLPWDPYTKQFVHLFRYPKYVTQMTSLIKCTAKFTASNLDFDVYFDVIKSAK